MQPKRTSKIDEILQESGAAGLIKYGQQQLEINRQTILNWMSCIGQKQSITVSDLKGKTEEVECLMVDLYSSNYNRRFENAPFYVKDLEIHARQAAMPEIVIKTPEDQLDLIANAGDWIIENPNDDIPYVIHNSDFKSLYIKKDENDNGDFRRF